MRTVVVREDAVRGTFEVVELAALRSPPEGGADEKRKYDGQRNQQEDDVHAGASVHRRQPRHAEGGIERTGIRPQYTVVATYYNYRFLGDLTGNVTTGLAYLIDPADHLPRMCEDRL